MVEPWLSEELLLGVLPIIGTEPADGHTREEDIIGVVEVNIIDLGTRVKTQHSVPPDWQHIYDVFIKHIQYEVCVSSVGLSTVHK